MYSSVCFMTIMAVLVMDVRTGALQDRDNTPRRCYNCRANDTTSCEEPGSWTTLRCPVKRPLCATTAIAPDFHSSLVCAPVVKTPCSVMTSSNSSFVITWTCNTDLCNSPFPLHWRNVFNFTSNSTETRELKICEFLFKHANNTEQDESKAVIPVITKSSTVVVRNSSEPTTSVFIPITINTESILRDSERPRAEALKQQPTVPSDDDEDETEGSGSYEDSRIQNNAVSAPAAPSSFLPANENSACSLYKDVLAATLFIYIVV